MTGRRTTSGHNTAGGGGGLRLFGVKLTDGSFIKKSVSIGNLSHSSAASESAEGYHSDDPDNGTATTLWRPIRKKGIPWTEEEHRQFLFGLQHLGRGDWRGISKNYVQSRTPSQVASHAQKYFIRQTNSARKKKRSSLFDMAPDMVNIPSPPAFAAKKNETLSVKPSPSSSSRGAISSLDLSLEQAFTPFSLQLWPPNAYSLNNNEARQSHHHHHQILTNVTSVQESMKELVGMSRLTLGETGILPNEALTFSLRIARNP